MEVLKFKTSIKCGGCIATVTPHLNKMEGIVKWSVDTVDPQKVLTVEALGTSPAAIIEVLKNAGYTAELLDA